MTAATRTRTDEDIQRDVPRGAAVRLGDDERHGP
jgi:hypothetical protein